MPKFSRFEEVPVWKEAARLYNRALDLLERHRGSLSRGFCDQLDRAALSVSNNIAEGFERVTTNELLMFLAIARGSAGEVRSMIAVVKDRPAFRPVADELEAIRASAESCCRQLTGWIGSIEDSPVKGKRHLDAAGRQQKGRVEAAADFRQEFLQSISPEHPLYDTPEARAARRAVARDSR